MKSIPTGHTTFNIYVDSLITSFVQLVTDVAGFKLSNRYWVLNPFITSDNSSNAFQQAQTTVTHVAVVNSLARLYCETTYMILL